MAEVKGEAEVGEEVVKDEGEGEEIEMATEEVAEEVDGTKRGKGPEAMKMDIRSVCLILYMEGSWLKRQLNMTLLT